MAYQCAAIYRLDTTDIEKERVKRKEMEIINETRSIWWNFSALYGRRSNNIVRNLIDERQVIYETHNFLFPWPCHTSRCLHVRYIQSLTSNIVIVDWEMDIKFHKVSIIWSDFKLDVYNICDYSEGVDERSVVKTSLDDFFSSIFW